MLKFKYKGRTFTNGQSLTNAITRDLNAEIERKVRQAASASGVRVQKTHQGFQVEGDADRMARFNNQIGR